MPGFIRKIATDNIAGSAQTILAANPLGGTCGAACPVERLCEGACVRTHLDHPIEIGRLQRHAVETYAARGGRFFEPGAPVAAQVAVIGAGPAGLACAAELRRAGIGVTIYDAADRAGGLADHGIVPWRLPGSLVATDVAQVERAGARFELGVTVGVDVEASEILADHDAVFLAVGLGRTRPLGIPGEGLPGVVDALDVIRRAIAGEPGDLALVRRLAVIGGGSTAFDAAAAARRLGVPEVTIYYRRTEAECPAYPHAIDLARSLGIGIRWLATPAAILGEDRVERVAFDTMTLGAPDASGRRSPVIVEGGRFEVELDVVVRAAGQAYPLGLLESFGVRAEGGLAVGDAATGRTSNPRVWVAGDIANGGSEVVDAVQGAKLAARSIRETLVPGTPIVAVERTASTVKGVDLSVDMAGIRSPNPFWLASTPIANNGEMVARAFDQGWGGVVWKTVGDPIVNVTSRLGALDIDDRRIVGLSNIELISDRPIEVNLAEVRDVSTTCASAKRKKACCWLEIVFARGAIRGGARTIGAPESRSRRLRALRVQPAGRHGRVNRHGRSRKRGDAAGALSESAGG